MQTLCSFDTTNKVSRPTPNSIYMDNYHLKQSAKTRFLNFFRSIFTIPVFEKLLLTLTLKWDNKLLQKVIPPDYLFKKGSIRMVERNGIKYKLDISHVVDHFIYWGLTDAAHQSVQKELKNARVIFDVGANIGYTSLYYASMNGTAQIFSFEPHPDIFIRAQENIALNQFRNINLINLGLGEKKEVLKLYEVNEHNPGMNRIIREEKDFAFKKINVDTLDQFVAEKNIEHLDLIKIDVEGFEYAVINGGKEAIQKHKPLLFIELDDNNLKENNSSALALVSLLCSLGYTKFYRTDNMSALSTSTDFSHCHYDMVAR